MFYVCIITHNKQKVKTKTKNFFIAEKFCKKRVLRKQIFKAVFAGVYRRGKNPAAVGTRLDGGNLIIKDKNVCFLAIIIV